MTSIDPGIRTRETTVAEQAGGRDRPIPAWVGALHINVLATFAVTQPVYSLLAERSAFLNDRKIGLPALLWIILAQSLLVPGGISAGVWGLSRLFPWASSGLHAAAIHGMLALIFLPLLKRVMLLHGALTIALAQAAAAAVTCAYFRFRPVRSLISTAAPAVVIFPAVFLFYSPLTETALLGMKPAPSGETPPAPVVLVVFDEFSGLTLVNQDRGIDDSRFPNFARLARDATWFRNATTVHSDTAQAVPAILSGKYPVFTIGAFPHSWDLPQNVFSVLVADAGYDLAALEPVSRLAPEGKVPAVSPAESLRQAASMAPICLLAYAYFIAPTDVQEYLPEFPQWWFGQNDMTPIDRAQRRGVMRYAWGDDRRGQFEHFLDCLSNPSRPTLFFIHDLLPHVHWCHLPSGRRYIPDGSNREQLDFNTQTSLIDLWGVDELFVVQSQQRYLLQTRFVDMLVGRLLDRLHATGLYDRCLLIVTADHGVSFRPEQSRRDPTPGNLADIMSIPLFIKTPGQMAGCVSDRNVQSIDILPTIADVLNLKLKYAVDGRSAFDTGIPERTEKTILNRDLVATTVPASILADSAAPAELLSRFGRGDDPEALYRIGPHPELIGRTVASLSISDEPPRQIAMSRCGTRYAADGAALVPCFFEGRIVSDPANSRESPVSLAVAVNGTIRAVTRTYRLDGLRDRWAAMVPEAALRSGENEVDFYVFDGAPSPTTLRRCHQTVNRADRR